MRSVRKVEIQRRYTAYGRKPCFTAKSTGNGPESHRFRVSGLQKYPVDRWLRIDPLEVYLNMLSPQEQFTPPRPQGRDYPFEDAAPILFLKGKLEGFPRNESAKWSSTRAGFSALQLRIIYELFLVPAFTILGDENKY